MRRQNDNASGMAPALRLYQKKRPNETFVDAICTNFIPADIYQ